MTGWRTFQLLVPYATTAHTCEVPEDWSVHQVKAHAFQLWKGRPRGALAGEFLLGYNKNTVWMDESFRFSDCVDDDPARVISLIPSELVWRTKPSGFILRELECNSIRRSRNFQEEFLRAVRCDDQEQVRQCLQSGCISPEQRKLALTTAADVGHEVMVKLLAEFSLQCGDSLNQHNTPAGHTDFDSLTHTSVKTAKRPALHAIFTAAEPQEKTENAEAVPTDPLISQMLQEYSQTGFLALGTLCCLFLRQRRADIAEECVPLLPDHLRAMIFQTKRGAQREESESAAAGTQ